MSTAQAFLWDEPEIGLVDEPAPARLDLRPLQLETLDKIRAAWNAGAKNVLVQAPCGFGKCHGIDTPILMADGTVKMVQDVVVGDCVLGPDGTPRNVLALGRGREMLYRVTPRKGDPYTVNESHILSLRKHGSDGMFLPDRRIDRAADIVAVPLLSFVRANATARLNLKGWRAAAVEFPCAPLPSLPIPPYVLGVWLGDGSSRGPAVTSLPTRMLSEWIDYVESIGLTVGVDQSGGRCPTYHAWTPRSGGGPNPITDALRSLNLLQNKHIPARYKTASAESRLELLAGLIDSNGHHIKGCYEWISKSERLARDFAFVTRSVGLACYVSPCTKRIRSTGFEGTYWRCTVSGDTDRIPSRDKPARPRSINKRHLVHGITLEPIGEGDYYGFQLDGDHLYLLGDFTVCHNTELATALLQATHENGKRAAFVCDRLSLLTQTSERFDKYGLPHGIIQADHWRDQPDANVQLCSIQTIHRRKWPTVNLLVADEAHVLPGALKERLSRRDCYAIGLTATPFTRGIGKYFDALVNAATTNQLIAQGWLSPYRIFAASEPDMRGVRVVNGEFEEKETERRVLPIVGDCVAEYLKVGEGRKFIVFAVSVAHAEELQRQFLTAGVVTSLYTYQQSDGVREKAVEEFRKPHSYIRGLISIEALTRGFDVADVGVLILARPLRKSLAVHMQMIGRVLRCAEGKTDAIILDHASNCVRFWPEMQDYLENGASKLDDGRKREKPKKTGKEAKPAKCPKCAHVHLPKPFCPACGYAYARRSNVEHLDGELRELTGVDSSVDGRQALYSQLLWIARQRNYNPRWAEHQFKERTGKWPVGLRAEIQLPSLQLLSWVKSRMIAYAKKAKKPK